MYERITFNTTWPDFRRERFDRHHHNVYFETCATWSKKRCDQSPREPAKNFCRSGFFVKKNFHTLLSHFQFTTSLNRKNSYANKRMATPSSSSGSSSSSLSTSGGGTKRKADDEDLMPPSITAVSQPEPSFSHEITQNDPYSKVPLVIDGKLSLGPGGKPLARGNEIDVLYKTAEKHWYHLQTKRLSLVVARHRCSLSLSHYRTWFSSCVCYRRWVVGTIAGDKNGKFYIHRTLAAGSPENARPAAE
jgi:hypothetical protein